jgi:hypothetical protein
MQSKVLQSVARSAAQPHLASHFSWTYHGVEAAVYGAHIGGRELAELVEAGQAREVVDGGEEVGHVADCVVDLCQAVANVGADDRLVLGEEGAGEVPAHEAHDEVVEHLDLGHHADLPGLGVGQSLGSQHGHAAVGGSGGEGGGSAADLDAHSADSQAVVADELVSDGLVVCGVGALGVGCVAGGAIGGREHEGDLIGAHHGRGEVLVARAHVGLGDLLQAEAPLEPAAGVGRIGRPELNVVEALDVEPVNQYQYI